MSPRSPVPYCGEVVEMTLDASGGTVQEYVQDCEVCCRPWQVSALPQQRPVDVKVETRPDAGVGHCRPSVPA